MRSKAGGSLLAVIGLMLAAVPVLAHHSVKAEFDDSKTVTVTGVLSKVLWVNPHIYWYVDTKDDTGKTVTWAFEGLPPGMLHRAGVVRDMLKVGEVVSTIAWPAKDGTRLVGFGKGIKYSDGREIVMTVGALGDQK
jgi:hypothetical protein